MLASISLLVAALALPALAQDSEWAGTGSNSFYWHNKYHGCLAMSVYGDYNTTCPQMFTYSALYSNFPDSTDTPWTVVGEFGPTEKYNMTGYVVRVPEMNKIVMIFRGQYGWQNYNATQVPMLDVGCDDTCMVHAGALEAWNEIKEETDNMAIVGQYQGDLVWSAAGHGWGGMVLQVAAMQLKYAGRLYSAQTFGAAPVFNSAGANQYDSLFSSDATSSMRTVSRQDSEPTDLTLGEASGEYQFVNTGIHVYGTNSTYGQNYRVCEDNPWDTACLGGSRPQDHYYYFTQLGSCCQEDDAYDSDWVYSRWQQDVNSYSATNGAALPNLAEATSASSSAIASSIASTPAIASDLSSSTYSSASAEVSSAAAADVNKAVVSASSASALAPFGALALLSVLSLLAMSA